MSIELPKSSLMQESLDKLISTELFVDNQLPSTASEKTLSLHLDKPSKDLETISKREEVRQDTGNC